MMMMMMMMMGGLREAGQGNGAIGSSACPRCQHVRHEAREQRVALLVAIDCGLPANVLC